MKKLTASNLDVFVKSSLKDNSKDPFSTFQFSDQPHYDLYVGSPESVSGDEALTYHVATRNLIAFAAGKALVGSSLSHAVLSLHDRIGRYRMDKQQFTIELLEYMESQGYLNLGESMEHSIAVLSIAEACELSTLWKRAFVHCVGMERQLRECPEFEVRCQNILWKFLSAELA